MTKAITLVLLFYAIVGVISACYIVAAIVDEPDTKIPYRKDGRRW